MDGDHSNNPLGPDGSGEPAGNRVDTASAKQNSKESESMTDHQNIHDDAEKPIDVFVAAVPDKSQPMNRADWMSDEDAEEFDSLVEDLLGGGEDE